MNKKFIYVIKPELYKGFLKKGLFKIIPDKLLVKFKDRLHPKVICKYIHKETGKVEGYGVGLTISNDYFVNENTVKNISEIINLINDKEVNEINLENLGILKSEQIEGIEKDCNLKVLNGRAVNIKVLGYVLKKIYSYNDTKVSEQEVLIIDGDNTYIEQVVMSMAEELKYLTILDTKGKNEIYDLANKFFENTGLAVHVTNQMGNRVNKFNLIINFVDDISINFKEIARKTIIFDFSLSQNLSKQIYEKRKDIMVISDFIFSRGQDIICDNNKFEFDQEISSCTYGMLSTKILEKDFRKVVINRKAYSIEEALDIYINNYGRNMSKIFQKYLQ